MRLRKGDRHRLPDPRRRLRRTLATVPLAMIVFITAADLLSPSYVHFEPLLVAAPAITASFAGPWFTAAVAVIALAAELFINVENDFRITPDEQSGLIGSAVVSTFIVLFTLVRSRQLTQARTVATAVQNALLQPVPSRLGPLALASAYLAAEAEARIGGDVYAAAHTRDVTRLIIGDVRGKGLPAISEAVSLLGAFRELARRHAGLPELVADLEDSLSFNQAQAEASDPGRPETAESFVTAAVLDIPDAEPTVTVVSCGHPPPLLLRGGRVIPLDTGQPALPLGLGALLKQNHVPVTFPFEAGDLLLLYTDGAIEARDAAGAFYPLADRVAAWTDEEPSALLDRICQDLLAHVGGRLGDDAALIAVRRLPDPAT
uniref:PP2C family protein-serine/threonine phosphatase n=1 Tax=Nonomuraea pusilla TaxID=46177 RepID=UPI0006E25235|nr:PP2C family protein-serine/threonine phosphatase [Nonomuraea pusilla]